VGVAALVVADEVAGAANRLQVGHINGCRR
jgi:hypothetical protein